MFDLSWGELVLIGMVALIVIGPKELPTVLRTVGQWMTRVRRMASEFQGQFQEAMREAEFADLKKQVDSISNPIQDLKEYNPLETVQREFDSALEDKPAATPGETAAPPVPESPLASADAPPAPPAEATSAEPSGASAGETHPPAPELGGGRAA